MGDTIAERLPEAVKRMEHFLGSDAGAKLPKRIYEDLLVITQGAKSSPTPAPSPAGEEEAREIAKRIVDGWIAAEVDDPDLFNTDAWERWMHSALGGIITPILAAALTRARDEQRRRDAKVCEEIAARKYSGFGGRADVARECAAEIGKEQP